ncbi:MAG: NAD(P)(+) transhydrogenase (Re/Si-specific) subunit beta [Clostridia bacterium]
MPEYLYFILSGVLSVGVLVGIFLMSKVKTSVLGNRISAVCTLGAIIVTLIANEILPVWALYIALAVGIAIGIIFALRVKMIQMPQMVALLNGLGGAASAIVGGLAIFGFSLTMGKPATINAFAIVTAGIALFIGCVTLIGSLIAAGKLHKVITQRPIIFKGHQIYTIISLILTVASVILLPIFYNELIAVIILTSCIAVFSSLFGFFFSIRVGGADMPITISLLNSLSGVAGAIAGLAVADPLLVAIGGIVGASGLLLTQIMCRSMNRHLMDILLGKTSSAGKHVAVQEEVKEEVEDDTIEEKVDVKELLTKAKKVIIVPGYGMAIAQAQHLVKQLADKLISCGVQVKYAVHPVAGRMPGHMNVLLCEANVDYEDLYEMDAINGEFADADATIVIGANDVLNPAANTAEGTPIYGMPVLNVINCKHIFIFNYDLKPGYAGVPNPIYTRKHGVELLLGNASVTLKDFIDKLN